MKKKQSFKKSKKSTRLALYIFILVLVAYSFLFLAVNTSFKFFNIDTKDSKIVNYLVPQLQDKNIWTVRY